MKLSKRSLSHLKGVNPLLIAIVVDAIPDAPHDFGIPSTGGYRSAKTQKSLYKQGVSKCDGYLKKSYHQSGNAFDIFGYVDGKATWDIEVLTAIAEHIIYVAKTRYNTDLTWGGNWKNFKDYPHFQI